MSTTLTFYKQPFRNTDHGWVYDANKNFVFQFEPKFDGEGEYVDGELEMQGKVLKSLNSEGHEPIPELELSLNDFGQIENDGEEVITIRGWGNLTGIGAHHFSYDKASKIQDDFRNWVLYKLSVN